MTYLFKLFNTGAIRKTPKIVITNITNNIDTNLKSKIVEFGAGKGEITSEVLKKYPIIEQVKYYAFETDPSLVSYMKKAFPEIKIINESALSINNTLNANEKFDYFISSIPLSFYSKKEITEFINILKTKLSNDGKILIILNAVWLIPLLKKLLPEAKVQFFFTFPVYFLIEFKLDDKTI